MNFGDPPGFPSAFASFSRAQGENQGDDEHGALDEILGVIGRIHHRQALQEDADEERADGGAESVRLGGTEHGKADQGGRDGIEKQVVAEAISPRPRRATSRMPPIEAKTPEMI